MTKYKEFLKFHSANYSKEYQEWIKIKLDEVIIEKLHEFVDFFNEDQYLYSGIISDENIKDFTQNNVSTNTENPYDLNKFGGLIKNKEE